MIKPKQDQTGPFQGVIFDLDGTLLDTLACIGTAFNQALTETGYPTHAIQDYKDFIGDGVFKCAERALPKAARELRLSAHWSRSSAGSTIRSGAVKSPFMMASQNYSQPCEPVAFQRQC